MASGREMAFGLAVSTAMAACAPETSALGTAGMGALAESSSGGASSSSSGIVPPSTTSGVDGGSMSSSQSDGPDPTSDTGVETSTTGGSTGSETGLREMTMQWPASVAECVLLPAGGSPYGGPGVCEQVVGGQFGIPQGLMIVDESVNDNGGDGRPAIIYLRFDWPPEIEGAPLLELELDLRVLAEDPPNITTGDLWTTSAFVVEDLLDLPVPAGDQMLFGSIGDAVPGTTVTWVLDPSDFSTTEPVTLRLEEYSTTAGIVYWNLDAVDPAHRPMLRARFLG